MSQFWVIEGGDGAGKSHLADRIATRLTSIGRQDIVVILKDQEYDQESWIGRRLKATHDLTWSYNNDEPVWEYSRQYWLYSLMAWYTLFHEAYIAPAIAGGATVVTDGWYFKHQARFRLSGISEMIGIADRLFSTLPQPDSVLWMDVPTEVAAERKLGKSKPSEHGAFDTGSSSLDSGSLIAYQSGTKGALWDALSDSACTIYQASHLVTPDEVVALIDQARKG